MPGSLELAQLYFVMPADHLPDRLDLPISRRRCRPPSSQKCRLPSCFFSAEEQVETIEEECAAATAAIADAAAAADRHTAGEEGRVVAPAELAEPSAPELNEDAAAAAGADAAFARAYKRHPGVVGLSEAGIAAVIS